MGLLVTRHSSARSFLDAARPVLLRAEAENNLILGVAEGMARTPDAVNEPYLATVSNKDQMSCAVYFAPFKLLLSRGDPEAMASLAMDAFAAVPRAEGVNGPDRSASDFAAAWSKLSGIEPRVGMRLRIHEARQVFDAGFAAPAGGLRPAAESDHDLLSAWTGRFVEETRIPEPVDSNAVVANSIRRGRLFVWEDRGARSMAAWAGKTPNGVRINFVYTPPELRRNGYATACVSALTRLQLQEGRTFCWLYTDASTSTDRNIFTRIGYTPVTDVTEYYFNSAPLLDAAAS